MVVRVCVCLRVCAAAAPKPPCYETNNTLNNTTNRYKWALSGTPLQNRVGEMYSQIRFLRAAPYAQYFCRAPGCACSSLDHAFTQVTAFVFGLVGVCVCACFFGARALQRF